MITAHAIPILSDNYAWLLRDSATGFTAIVDPAEDAPIEAAIQAHGGRLDMIVLTHHHSDHIAAVEPIRARYGVPVVGAKADAHRLPKLDTALAEGSTLALGSATAEVMETYGHTVGHISFYIPDGGVLLCGDTLLALGCGRLSEGTPAQMFDALQRFAKLPGETLVCCGHEYTASNARFALSADPDNKDLQAYAARVTALRDAGRPTVPSRLADELTSNPFIRAKDVAVFADLRARKDKF
jgi:hydroxyacylglutathione hydrolase